MPNLIDKPAMKSAAYSRQEEQVRRARAGHASWSATIAGMASNQAEAGRKPQAFVSGFGGASNLSEAQAVARKADLPDLPDSVRRISHRMSPEAAKLLGAVVRRSDEENGKPITFTSDEAMTVTGLPRDQAQSVIQSLLRSGFLIERNGASGGSLGFTPFLPAS